MSTRFVITACCQAPVELRYPNVCAMSALLVCTGCNAVAGAPGAEDSPDVDAFLTRAAQTEMWVRPVMRG